MIRRPNVIRLLRKTSKRGRPSRAVSYDCCRRAMTIIIKLLRENRTDRLQCKTFYKHRYMLSYAMYSNTYVISFIWLKPATKK